MVHGGVHVCMGDGAWCVQEMVHGGVHVCMGDGAWCVQKMVHGGVHVCMGDGAWCVLNTIPVIAFRCPENVWTSLCRIQFHTCSGR